MIMKIKAEGAQTKVQAEIFAAFPESVLNLAAAQGIEMWELESTGQNSVRFKIYESRAEELGQLAKRSSAELSLLSFSEPRRRLLKRRFKLLLLIGLVLAGLFTSSLFIWQIELHGAYSMSKGELMRALEESGVYVGRFWPGLKADEVRNKLMVKLPELAWMTVNLSGSRAVVLLTQRQEKPEIYNEADAADIVAAKTGLLRRVSALQGKALTNPGDAVTKGELLIGGRLDSIMGTERTVRARGSVMADTWYEINSVCPVQENIKIKSVPIRHRFALVFGKRRINLYISSGKAIDECDKIINEYTLGLDGHFALPVRLVHECVVPYVTETGGSPDEQQMMKTLASILDKQLEGQILSSSYTQADSQGLYVLTLRAHCVENIAQTQSIID